MPVDLEQLALLMGGDPMWGGGWIDLKTGDCGSQARICEDDSFDEDEGR
ncbi:hypothetical protein ABFA25_06625 [Mycobacterium lepromatosis]